jgi:peptidoglycan lytic transglycosylase B
MSGPPLNMIYKSFHMMSPLKFFPLILSSLCFVPAALADSYGDNMQALAVVDELVAEQGYKREVLLGVMADAERQQSILDAISRPAEKAKPWYEYREIFLTDKREQRGREFMELHRETLQRAEDKFGVPKEVVVAIIGVETFYGRITGSYRVLDALATLAFDYPKRSTFFTKELKNFLILAHEGGMDPRDLKGSYAGAMGYGQFMPSSYRAYAVDFDDDGEVDIWNNPVDAIGSVANYFKQHGWRNGEPVVYAADAQGEVDEAWFKHGLKPSLTVAEYAAGGIAPRAELDPQTLATAMQFELEEGYEYWMGVHNFYVITRYNHSSMYAMSVHQLSQRLAK